MLAAEWTLKEVHSPKILGDQHQAISMLAAEWTLKEVHSSRIQQNQHRARPMLARNGPLRRPFPHTAFQTSKVRVRTI
jgi:hypothetical protein